MKRKGLIVLLFLIPFFGMSQSLEELNKPIISVLDEVAPFYEGLAAVRKGDKWGFIDEKGKLVIDFRNDIAWNKEVSKEGGIASIRHPYFKEGLCVISRLTEEGIPLYGFMNTKGETVIEPEYINISPFENGKTVGIYGKKSFRGKNEFQLNIYDYSFTEVVVNNEGEMIWPIQKRINILMSKSRYELPVLHAKILADDLLAVKGKNSLWKVVKTDINKS